jgi:hypothetical protein
MTVTGEKRMWRKVDICFVTFVSLQQGSTIFTITVTIICTFNNDLIIIKPNDASMEAFKMTLSLKKNWYD